jgi:hypothetical protein
LQTTYSAQPAIVVAKPRITAAATPTGLIASWGAMPVMGHSNLSLCDCGR